MEEHKFHIIQRKLLRARLTGTAQEQKILEKELALLFKKLSPLEKLDPEVVLANSIGSTYQIEPKP